MTWVVYNILFCIGYLLLLPHFLLRMLRRGGYRKNFSERFGVYHASKRETFAQDRIWVHAVSVGEVQLALALIDAFRAADPTLRFVVSTTTSTGYAILAQRKHKHDVHIYFPVDFPFVVRRVVGLIRPRAVVLLECELWPNFLRCLSRHAIPVWVVNGRISERSFNGYRKVRFFFRRAAAWVHTFFVQTEQDAARLRALGAASIQILGSAKFDVPIPNETSYARAQSIVTKAGMDPSGMFWVMGSTWPGEEACLLAVLRSLRNQYPALQAILVPRHAERGTLIEGVLRESGLPYVRRSTMTTSSERGQPPAVLLADTTGELAGYYMLATFVFVGKSMASNHGGQNPVEPAALGKAVVTGENMENFSGVMGDLRAAHAIEVASDFTQLEKICTRFITDDSYRRNLGERAAALVAERRGVMDRSARLILAELAQSQR